MNNYKLRPIGVAALLLITFVMFTSPLSAKEAKEAKESKTVKETNTKPTKAKTPENAAIVNGKTITYVDFEREFEIYKNHFNSKNPNLPPSFVEQLRSQVVNEMVNQELLHQASQKQKIKVEKESLEKEMAAFQKRFPSTEEYQAWLKKMGFSEDKFQAQFAQRMAVRTLIEKEIVSKVNIKDDEVKAYFENNKEKFKQKESVRARHILMKLDKTADDAAKAKARKELDDIRKKLLAGEDFATLAKAHSQGPSNAKGGDLGYFSKGQMVKPFEEVAFKLAVNEVSDIVETQFGYHLIKVLDRKEAKVASFEEIKEGTKKRLNNERIQKDIGTYIDTLRKSAKIETFLK